MLHQKGRIHLRRLVFSASAISLQSDGGPYIFSQVGYPEWATTRPELKHRRVIGPREITAKSSQLTKMLVFRVRLQGLASERVLAPTHRQLRRRFLKAREPSLAEYIGRRASSLANSKGC